MLIITGESVSLGNLVALAESERAGGHFGEALKQAQVVIARNPNYSSGQLVAGRCHLEMGEFRLALELLGRAVEIDGDNTLALRLLGDALALSGMRQEAEAVYERGGAASGDSQGVELARKILSMGKSDPAHQDAEEERAGIIRGSMNPAEMLDAADLELKGAFGTATMAQICEEQGLLDSAFEIYDSLLEKYPDSSLLVGKKAQLKKKMAEVAAQEGAGRSGE